MYYITPKSSETGKRFDQLMEKFKVNHEAKKAIASKYGFNQWTEYTIDQSIGRVIFPDGVTTDAKLWQLTDQDGMLAYKPNRRTKAGKELEEELMSVKGLYPDEINYPVLLGKRDELWSSIGFTQNDEYYGFITPGKWKFEMPEDCEEVTSKRYKELFPDKTN